MDTSPSVPLDFNFDDLDSFLNPPPHQASPPAREPDEPPVVLPAEQPPAPAPVLPRRPAPARQKDISTYYNSWIPLVPMLRVWPRELVEGSRVAYVRKDESLANPCWEKTQVQYLRRLCIFLDGELARFRGQQNNKHSIFMLLRFWSDKPLAGAPPSEAVEALEPTRVDFPAAKLAHIKDDILTKKKPTDLPLDRYICIMKLNSILGTFSKSSYASAWLSLRAVFYLAFWYFAHPGRELGNVTLEYTDIKKSIEDYIMNRGESSIPTELLPLPPVEATPPPAKSLNMTSVLREVGVNENHLRLHIQLDEDWSPTTVIPPAWKHMNLPTQHHMAWLHVRILPYAVRLCQLFWHGFKLAEDTVRAYTPNQHIGTIIYPVRYRTIAGYYSEEQAGCTFYLVDQQQEQQQRRYGYRYWNANWKREQLSKRRPADAPDNADNKVQRVTACVQCGSMMLDHAIIVPSMGLRLCGSKCTQSWLSSTRL
jgi:hypothetical protein